MNKGTLSLICAVSCSFLWGTAFIAQDTGMDYIGPWTFSAARLLLGFFALLPFFFIFEFKKIVKIKSNFKIILANMFLLGFFLAGGNIFQQISLLYTDVANSAVFTVLYVVIVPVLAYFLFSKSIHKSVWPAVMMCLLGGLFLSELDNYRVRLGDSLVVVGAFFWALHIVYVSKFLKIFNYPITIAAFQCLIAAILSAIPAASIELISFKLLSLEAGELLYAGILSSGFAFLLQIIALQHLSPAPAAIIFSLEGVFASIAAWFILDQFLNEYKIFGIIIILSAVIFSQLAPMYDKRKYGRN
ncbi:MAG: EamA family transporter [Pelagibacterales bacterium MED-G40]|nr:MAG: EamA family transporter [Candidatus Pelagibacter sp. TMED203]PDH20401.1 MAG: EamA family transporter [Pelagibacterales bacterium MED-G40]|tara:strand:+ start:8827 stop:9729 length:903 start_codon:yes stop_codon:yes gene_type:complete